MEVQRCRSTIEIHGHYYQCEQNVGPTHEPHHSADVRMQRNVGMIVQWIPYREVTPARTGCGPCV